MVFIRRYLSYKSVLFVTFVLWLPVAYVQISRTFTKKTFLYSNDYSIKSFDVILNYLVKFHSNVVLIDPYLLNFLFIRQLSFKQFKKSLITFGIFSDSIEYFHPLVSLSNISIRTSSDHIFIEYNQHIVHLAVLYEKKTHFLIKKNTVQLPDHIQLSFGDTIRVIESFSREFQRDKFSFFVPDNISHFLWLYQTSEFVQCHESLADRMEDEYQLYQNDGQINLVIPSMRYIASSLTKLEKRYWLAGGTLLGWYRHCGLIPYTQDVDLGLFAEEYDENIRKHFLGNSEVYLWAALGLVNDSLEFRLFTGQYTFDLFWAYREDDHRWCGYQMNRMKYKRLLPLLPKLCSGILFDFIYTIPCSPEDYLNNEYGIEKWHNPLKKSYSWINIQSNSMWDDRSWMYAVRLYTRDGKLRTDKFAIDWIEKYFNYSLKRIPSFLNILPNEKITLPPLKKLAK